MVGAGPGDPELLTLKALRLIKNCDALVHDALIPDEIIKEAGKNTAIYHVGKRAGKCSVPQAETNALILKLAKEGKMGKSILSLNRSFRRVTKALSRVNFLFGFNKLSFTIFTFIAFNFYYHTC